MTQLKAPQLVAWGSSAAVVTDNTARKVVDPTASTRGMSLGTRPLGANWNAFGLLLPIDVTRRTCIFVALLENHPDSSLIWNAYKVFFS
jgi:hypothetical protein